MDVEGAELRVTGGALVSRPTLVALHGGPGFDSGYLRPGLGPLSSHAQVVYVDLRGQGRSLPAEPASCTLEQMADDVAALSRTLGITHPVVFGHSSRRLRRAAPRSPTAGTAPRSDFVRHRFDAAADIS